MNNRVMRVSIVVACRNEAGQIREFLDSLLAQDMGGLEWEAIIADGMSDDGTAEIVEAYGRREPRIQLIQNPGRIVSTGLNAAIRAARGEVVLRMDAHTRYASDYCRRCVETLIRTGAENVGGPARTEAQGRLARAIAAAYHSRFSTGGAPFHRESCEGWVDTVPYGCWWKATLERLGMFDETLVRNQDDELNLRLVRAGGRIWQDPKIVSWYTPRRNLRSLFHQYFQYGFWKVAVIRKHRLPGSWRHLTPALFVGSSAILSAAAMTTAAGPSASWAASPWVLLWLASVGAYATANLAASLVTARRAGWDILAWLPMVFATYHISYGAGFLFGLVCQLTRRREKVARAGLVTDLTR